MPKLYRVIIPVGNIDTAVLFYSTLLGIPGKRVSGGRHYFNCDGVILACFDPRADGDSFDATPNPDHVYFAVENLDETYQRATGLPCRELEGEIRVRPWGERSFYAKDPFGNPLCLVDETTLFTGEDAP